MFYDQVIPEAPGLRLQDFLQLQNQPSVSQCCTIKLPSYLLRTYPIQGVILRPSAADLVLLGFPLCCVKPVLHPTLFALWKISHSFRCSLQCNIIPSSADPVLLSCPFCCVKNVFASNTACTIKGDSLCTKCLLEKTSLVARPFLTSQFYANVK
ncbi:hypothetical protein NDU88_000875 [Pleurodeles waltl]|uniref:Uncharacterized protein n=1 Tax=Pleurodeles waltl TaxID=8319 RepID=A0AAV7KN53_PLEWA|nr:hypothetical protein NDU88_000875 [Pleurodeles waltl]